MHEWREDTLVNFNADCQIIVNSPTKLVYYLVEYFEAKELYLNFEEFSLDPRIMAGVKEAGFVTPTPIQEQAIPIVLEGGDVLGLAQTGTGKTAAFMLPILQRLMRGPLRKIRVLVVAPTRELAEQIHETCVDFGKKTKIRSATIYGGVGKGPQLRSIRQGTEVIVACPGRLLDHINEGSIDLSDIEVLVLDEADRMCDMGFLPDIKRILKHLPTKRQTLFFSATMPKDIRTLADTILKNPQTVQIGMIAPAKTVSHALYPVPEGLKKGLLFDMLKETETDRVLIFTRTKRRARFLAADLEKRGYRVSALQGNMAQNRRQEAINGFREGKFDVLVATDIAARGIDVTEISHVINFDIPDTVDAYTHRIGRTGRAKQSGEAFTFITQADEPMVRDIERALKMKIERCTLPGFNYAGYVPSRQGGGQGGGQRGGRGNSRNSSRGNGQGNSQRNSQGGGRRQSSRNGAATSNDRPAQNNRSEQSEGQPQSQRRRKPSSGRSQRQTGQNAPRTDGNAQQNNSQSSAQSSTQSKQPQTQAQSQTQKPANRPGSKPKQRAAATSDASNNGNEQRRRLRRRKRAAERKDPTIIT